MSTGETLTTIRAAGSGDAAAIVAIYNWYIAHSSCTFEEEALDVRQMAERIAQAAPGRPWLVIEEGGEVLGYAYATIWKDRAAYGRSREVTIYLHKDAAGRGLGRRLYGHLIDEIRKAPIHSLIASIALPNAGSVALHEALGFTKVGQLNEVGHKFGEFVDVGYWQLLL